jgi:hypothetical protein
MEEGRVCCGGVEDEDEGGRGGAGRECRGAVFVGVSGGEKGDWRGLAGKGGGGEEDVGGPGQRAGGEVQSERVAEGGRSLSLVVCGGWWGVVSGE